LYSRRGWRKKTARIAKALPIRLCKLGVSPPVLWNPLGRP
jgi:hypothetical protein